MPHPGNAATKRTTTAATTFTNTTNIKTIHYCVACDYDNNSIDNEENLEGGRTSAVMDSSRGSGGNSYRAVPAALVDRG